MNDLLTMVETELVSGYGLRSLSPKDQFYHFESDYQRGNIFVWQNYLVLRGIKLYYSTDLRMQKLYTKIRSSLLKTVQNEFDSKNYLYEYYSDITG